MSGSLKSLFDGLGSALDALARRAAAAQTLTDKVRVKLPEPLRPHLVSASRRGDDLVVIMDSGVWTPRVRYAATALKASLAAEGESFAGTVKVKVRAGTMQPAD
jgi:hypothetical protein